MNYIWMYNTAFCSLVLKCLGMRLCILLLHHFCASSNISTVHALLLEYAFHPISLILIPYICLYKTPWQQFQTIWQPFHTYFVYTRRRSDSKASIITTFPLLSFSKVLFVSFTLLYTFQFQHNYHDNQRNCVLIQQLSAIFIGVVHIWSYSCVYVGSIYNQFFSFCTPQDCLEGVSHAVNFAGGMIFTCL